MLTKSFQCGTKKDQRTVEIELPETPGRIAVFLSGGIDSALLYHILLQVNKEFGNPHTIVPLTIQRTEGSKIFSKLVVAHINDNFGLPYQDPITVGNPDLPQQQQVESGVREAWRLGYHMAFLGLIDQQPQHMIGWDPVPYQTSYWFRAPLEKLNKTHIIDLCNRLEQNKLYYITHTCNSQEVGRCYNCNGCNERSWGFEQLGLKDPGNI